MTGIDELLKWEQHPSRTLYSFRDLEGTKPRFIFKPEESPAPQGTAGWFVGEQNAYGFQMFMTGVRLGNENRREFGKQVILAGLGMQEPDGSFPCPDAHHSAAFFLEVVARLIILSDRTDAGDLLPFYRGLCAGAQWFGAPGVWQDGWWRDRMHHRFFLNSAVLYLADVALKSIPDTPDNRWYHGSLPFWCHETAEFWLKDGISRQRADGAITEGGGHDTGYHSLATTFMTGTLMVAELDNELRNSLTNCLVKAAKWLCSRVDGDGHIDASGNTRMTPDYGGASGRFGPGGTIGIKYYETAFALYGAGLYLEDEQTLSTVEKIMDHYDPTDF